MNSYKTNCAMDLVKDFYLEHELSTEKQEDLINAMSRVMRWQHQTKIQDPTTLAALALSGDYEYPITAEEADHIKEFFFPSEYTCETTRKIEL